METRLDEIETEVVVLLVRKGKTHGKVLYRATHPNGLCTVGGCPCRHNVRPASAVAHGGSLDLVALFVGCNASGVGGWLPTEELLTRAGIGWSSVTLGRALRAAGCTPTRNNVERGWFPPEKLKIPDQHPHTIARPLLRPAPTTPEQGNRRKQARAERGATSCII